MVNKFGTFFQNNKKEIAIIGFVSGEAISTALTFKGAQNPHEALKLATGSHLPSFIVAVVSFACFAACMIYICYKPKDKIKSQPYLELKKRNSEDQTLTINTTGML
jgi:hypothetical protein